MSHFILNQTHPLIPREQNYVLDRKIISIHSTDRDISKWPKANHFGIDLPEDITNVQSIRLVEIQLPNSQYVFTTAYQNTKLAFSISTVGKYSINKLIIITIDEGSYTVDQLTKEISTKMNKGVTNAIITKYPCCLSIYNGFVCTYNSVSNKFWFGNNQNDKFILFCDYKIYYDIPCGQAEVWNNYSKWGLPAYLGYSKKEYTSSHIIKENHVCGYGFDHDIIQWLPSKSKDGGVTIIDISGCMNDPNYCCQQDVYGEKSVYMEIEKYNSIDEIVPWSKNTIGEFNNDYSGKVDSAFAKIPVGLANSFSLLGDSKQFYLMNSTVFSPPIERISKLLFTFRFHDGRRVEFMCQPFNFSLEINMLHDEQPRRMNVRIPVSFIN